MTRTPGAVKGGPQGRPAGTEAKLRPLTAPVSCSSTMDQALPRRGGACLLRCALHITSTGQMRLFSKRPSGASNARHGASPETSASAAHAGRFWLRPVGT
jgi:hypothetical protein